MEEEEGGGNLPRTGRTFGNAMSNIGSAGRRTATLSSQENVPLRLLLQSASQSWASCTSRQVTFPLTGHQPISQVIVNATIQLVSIYVTRTTLLSLPLPVALHVLPLKRDRRTASNVSTTMNPCSLLLSRECHDQRSPSCSSSSFSL